MDGEQRAGVAQATAAAVALVGGVLIAIGAVMPWYAVSQGLTEEQLPPFIFVFGFEGSGTTESGGLIVLLLGATVIGLAALAMARVRFRISSLGQLAAAASAAGIAVYHMAAVDTRFRELLNDLFDNEGTLRSGRGPKVVFAGACLVVAATLWSTMTAQRRSEPSPAEPSAS